MKVLVTGAGALLGQGIIKSLLMADTEYHIIAVDPDPRAVGLYWADVAHLVPLVSEAGYIDRVFEIIEGERPDAVLIGTDVELMIFARNRSDIESVYKTKIIVSSPEIIQIADDKWLTNQFLLSNGFPFPKSALPSNIADLTRHCDFPLIVKPRSGARSVGVHRVNNEEELRIALSMVYDPIIQENISNSEQEFTSGIVMSDGCAKAVVTMRRELKDGNTYRAYVEPNSSFEKVLLAVAEKLGGMGPLNFQFRSDDGVPKIFEINARFSGTTPLRAYAGFNEVDHLIRNVVLGEEIPEPELQSVVILRYWDEILIKSDQVSTLKGRERLCGPEHTEGFRI